MKTQNILRATAPAFILFLFAGTMASQETTQGRPGNGWKASGELEEACSCDAACPCWFDSKPTRMTCAGGFALFFDKASYGSVSLDGLALAAIGENPPGTTMMNSMGQWRYMNILIDEKASPEHRKALLAIAKQTLPPFAPPERARVAYVPIYRSIAGQEHTVRIGDVSVMAGHLVEGGLGGPPRISNPPAADPIHREYRQGHSSELSYHDGERSWSFANTNYMFAAFDVSSEDYEKFMSAMAQKMAGGKKK
jgi:hypothetical protein